MNFLKKHLILTLLFVFSSLITSCNSGYQMFEKDIVLSQTHAQILVGETLVIEVAPFDDDGVSYKWSIDDKVISTSKNLSYTFSTAGTFTIVLTATEGASSYNYNVTVEVSEAPYTLQEDDITLLPFSNRVAVGETLTIEVNSVSDENVSYEWFTGEESISQNKNLEYTSEVVGEQIFKLTASQDKISFSYYASIEFTYPEVDDPNSGSSAYITKVFDYLPSIGQHINTSPKYEAGDTQESMNQKALARIGGVNDGSISLGGYGGYVVVGFDHTIVNKEGLCDFRVYGNAFNTQGGENGVAEAKGASSEPGIIMVAYDLNNNGLPDKDEWYEIAGSAHNNPTDELWYNYALDKGLDMNFYSNYQITYSRESKESTTFTWSDNKGGSGIIEPQSTVKPNFPAWIDSNELTFKGSRLPQNGIDEAKEGSNIENFVLYCFNYGYADNMNNDDPASAIDISWAVDQNGNRVSLPGVDFIKIYTGVNQSNGWLGECSCDIAGIADLHILEEEIQSNKF